MKVFNFLIKVSLLLVMIVGMGEWSMAFAEEGSALTIDTGDTAWILVSSAFVLCLSISIANGPMADRKTHYLPGCV